MKNLRTLLYMLTLLLSVVGIQPVEAQEPAVQDALYIYRNDGGFHGFFYSDIERFDYSRIDTLGVEHEDYVVQEIYANDSIYRIPLSAIDSISFVTPETVYKDDVAHTSESDLWNYVVSSDSTSTFVLAANTPQALVPKKGDKLVNINQSPALPAGFIGQVANVNHDVAGITVSCDLIDLTDVFVQYVAKTRTVDEDEAAARGIAARASSETPTITTKDDPFDTTIDMISPGIVAQYGQILVSGKMAKVRIHGIAKKWLRIFQSVGLDGVYKDWQMRYETDTYITPTFNASLTNRLDIPFAIIAPIPVPGLPGAWLTASGGFTISLTGSINTVCTYHSDIICVESIQQNISLAMLDGYRNQKNRFHLQKHTHSFSIDKVSGSVSGALGFYSSASLSLGLPEVGPKLMVTRIEMGVKPSLSAEFKEGDFTQLLPSMLGMGNDNTYSTSYHLLSREGSIILLPYVSAKVLIGLGFAGTGLWETLENSYDLDKLRADYPSAFKKRWWAVEGQLAPTFSAPSLEFKDESAAPTATVGIGGRAVLDTPVGFAAYYSKSGKQLGKTLWYSKNYKSWYNWVDDYATNDNITEYSLKMPKFGGGKEIHVYPTYKLFDHEMLGNPVATVTIPAKLESDPPELTFEADGGEETLTISDNLDRNEDKYTDEYGVTAGDDEKNVWLSVKKEGEGYKVTAKPNTTGEERNGSVDFYIYNEDKSIDLVLNVPVVQKAPEYEFSVKPEELEVAGYSKDFKGGELTKQITIVYPNTAKDIKVSSSDESWLTVDKAWDSNTPGDLNTTGIRKIHIKPNFNLESSRDAVITVEMTAEDGSVDTRSMMVKQLALDLKVELDPADLILTAAEKKNAAYSHKAIVNIKMDPWDNYLKNAIKKQELNASADWIEANVKDDVIEVRAEANPKEEERKGTITYTVTMKDGGSMSKTIDVTQLEKQEITAFTFNPNPVRFPVNGGEKKVYVEGDDVDHIIEIDCKGSSWLGGAASGLSMTLSAKESDKEDERITVVYITAKMKDGTTEKEYFLVYQDGTKTTHSADSCEIREIQAEVELAQLMDGKECNYKFTASHTFKSSDKSIQTVRVGNSLHVTCSAKRVGESYIYEGTLSFDIDDFSDDAIRNKKANIINLHYSYTKEPTEKEKKSYHYNHRESLEIPKIPIMEGTPHLNGVWYGTRGEGVNFNNFVCKSTFYKSDGSVDDVDEYTLVGSSDDNVRILIDFGGNAN